MRSSTHNVSGFALGGYVLRQQTNDGKWKCLIFSGNNGNVNPERFLWGSAAGGVGDNCGFDSETSLLSNKQAVFMLEPIGSSGDRKYILRQQTNDGKWKCLIFSGNNGNVNPERFLWGSAAGGVGDNCGFDSETSLLSNKQAVFMLEPIGCVALAVAGTWLSGCTVGGTVSHGATCTWSMAKPRYPATMF